MVVFMFLLFLVPFHEAQAQTNNFNITRGSSLRPTSNSSWLSPSGLYAFGFYEEGDGFAVGIFIPGIADKTVVWTANRDKDHVVPSNATLFLTTDGRLIVQVNEREIDIANPSEPILSASIKNNGNFVLYNSDQNITWQSFDHPTDTLLETQRLSADQKLFSRVSETNYSKGRFRLVMQMDGNLVQYPAADEDVTIYNAYYATGTNGAGDKVTLNLEDDGHLLLLNGIENIKNITPGGYPTQRRIYRMRLDVDGIFRLYSYSLNTRNSTPIWSSTRNGCAPKGICGVNQFCVLMDRDVVCRCLPGFNYISNKDRSSGCERNFTAASCKDVNQSVGYNMRRSENTVWENTPPYTVLQTKSVEDCEQRCLEDCSCDVALFKDQQCRKQRLPLRFGSTNIEDPTIALTKVGRPASRGNGVTRTITEKTKEIPMYLLIVSISLICVAVLVLAIAGIVFHGSRQSVHTMTNKIQNGELVDGVGLRKFSYAELVQITNNFDEELGKGASGTVYKGVLSDCENIVAVKKLEKELAEGEREFQTEMKVIAKTHHRNLVSLLGYCIDGSNRVLVYEFMGNGSLADILFAARDRLSFTERVGITTDIVKGILYLHEECETQIIHCDIKPQNILMDENMCAKISDFGLAKHLKQDQTRTYTGVRGTRGYVAPEWMRKLPVTVKADVYSFGNVLLEIICHRKNVDWNLPENEAVLDEWVYECFMAGELSKLVPDEEVDMKKLEKWVKVGLWCIQEEPSLRPSMKKVLLMLEGTVDVPIPPSPLSYLSSL
ncbi:hypothetical protein LIER_22163 [Lithospermum erythrorhizon]|uniref:Receptor-like serine/threonine-protein kinase n=1 Tax=Lithospermum erythrorhizon TaxID=34254 RepID=A0AAV3Q794_LITER